MATFQETTCYDRTVPLGATTGLFRAPRRRRNRQQDRFRVKPGWIVLIALAILPMTPLCDGAPGNVAMATANVAGPLQSGERDGTIAGIDAELELGVEHTATFAVTAPSAVPFTTADTPTPALVLDAVRPPVPAAPARKYAKRVLIVGLDGVRPDSLKKAKTPHLDALARAGAYHFDGRAGEITLSGPGWASLLVGVNRHRHGILNNRVSDLSKFKQWPTLFHRYHQKYPKKTTASIVGWRPLNTKLLAAAPVNVAEHGGDRLITRRATELLSNDPNLGLLFVHLDNVDTAGHTHGHHPHRKGYLRAIQQVDTRLGRILAALDQRADRDEWLILVTTDHGGSKDGSHGRDLLDHRRIFVVVSGPGVQRGQLPGTPTLTDMTATVVEHVNLPPLDRGRALDGTALGLPAK